PGVTGLEGQGNSHQTLEIGIGSSRDVQVSGNVYHMQTAVGRVSVERVTHGDLVGLGNTGYGQGSKIPCHVNEANIATGVQVGRNAGGAVEVVTGVQVVGSGSNYPYDQGVILRRAHVNTLIPN